jgi:predicted MFS family arabinose efflux permease
MAGSIIDATLNNFLNFRFALTGFQRSFLEMPRELPGLLVVVVSALLAFLCSRRLGALSMVFSMLGAVLMGTVSRTYGLMMLWLFLYSLGQHLFIPVSSAIGMELAAEGKIGKRLGQLNSVRNLSAVIGSFAVFLAFKYAHLTFKHTFIIAGAGFAVSAVVMFMMQPKKPHAAKLYLRPHREYRSYYLLAVLYGSRKQLFLTFAPWVLVTVFRQPTQTIATLLTIGGVIGIFFQPLLGWSIDRFGEKAVLAAEALLLIVVCAGYGFSRTVFAPQTAFFVACGCFLLDQMLMSVNMARTTYMRKIAKEPSHVQPSLTLATSLDHVFSISIALIAGTIWSAFGYQYVFLLGAVIAGANLVAALRINLPGAASSGMIRI